MVTAEGIFPKIGNDPIYASEINGFNNLFSNAIYTQTGSHVFVHTTNASEVQTCGSLLFNGFSGKKAFLVSADVIGFQGTANGYPIWYKTSTRPINVGPLYSPPVNTSTSASCSAIVVASSGDYIYLFSTKDGSANTGSMYTANVTVFGGNPLVTVSGSF